MGFVLFRVFSLGIISCMIISFRSSMRNKQHADIAHDVVLRIQAFICRLFYVVLAIYRSLYLQSVCLFYKDYLSLRAVQAQETGFQHLFYMDLCL